MGKDHEMRQILPPCMREAWRKPDPLIGQRGVACRAGRSSLASLHHPEYTALSQLIKCAPHSRAALLLHVGYTAHTHRDR